MSAEKTVLTKYTDEEVKELTKIAKEDRSNWNPLIEEFCRKSRRTYAGVYYKLGTIALEVGNVAPTRSRRQKAVREGIKNSKIRNKGRRPKKKASGEVIKYVSKGSNMHPMKSSRTLAVTPNEIRFPYTRIRLEGGEVIISI
jgi:hypothetical protein